MCLWKDRREWPVAVAALRELGFDLTAEQAAKSSAARILSNSRTGPSISILSLLPTASNDSTDAWQRHVDVEGFPVCHIDDIIASKEATGRAKIAESLPRLKAFREYWLRQHQSPGRKCLLGDPLLRMVMPIAVEPDIAFMEPP